jgi:hypothetical protein
MQVGRVVLDGEGEQLRDVDGHEWIPEAKKRRCERARSP